MEQLSNILTYAQDCDAHVLKDLYKWFNYLADKLRRLSRPESAAAAAEAATVIEEIMIRQKNSQVNFLSGGHKKRNEENKWRKHL